MHFIDMSLSLQDRADTLSYSYLKNGFWVLFRNDNVIYFTRTLASYTKGMRKKKDLNHHMSSLE